MGVPVLLERPPLVSAQKVPVDPVWLGSQLQHLSPNQSSSESHLRYPVGSLLLRAVLPVVVRRKGPSSCLGVPPSYLQSPLRPELPS